MGDFQVHILASGSKGNAAVIQAGSTAVLIDAGISARRIKLGLKKLALEPADLAGIFLTHEHRDHISGLPVFCKNAAVPVFANESTWFASGCIAQVPSQLRRMLPLSNMQLGDLTVKAFAISHDAASPVGFNFFYRDQKCSFATDLGFVCEDVKKALAESDAIVIEANHDQEMLLNGRYPYYLKSRIKGKKGHLANAETGKLLAEIVANKKTQVFLAHLSQENNCPGIAKKTVEEILAQKGILQRTELYVASQTKLVSNVVKESD